MDRLAGMACVVLIGLAACNQSNTAGDQADKAALRKMVAAGDVTACASTHAEAGIRDRVEDVPPDHFPEIGTRQVPDRGPQYLDTSLDGHRLKMHAPETKRLVCVADWLVTFRGERLGSIPVVYSLQSDAERNEVWVEVMDINRVRGSYTTALMRSLEPHRLSSIEHDAINAADEAAGNTAYAASPERILTRRGEAAASSLKRNEDYALEYGTGLCAMAERRGDFPEGARRAAQEVLRLVERTEDPHVLAVVKCLTESLELPVPN